MKKNYLVQVVCCNIDTPIELLNDARWLSSASSGSYYHETASENVIQSFYDKRLESHSEIQYEYHAETHSIYTLQLNLRFKALSYEGVADELADILRQCE